MPFLVLLALFVVVPIVEIYVIIQVGQAIGALWTVALLIADSIAGTLLMKSQGRAAWRRFQLALGEGRVPAREVIDGVLVIFGGAFLLTPGLRHRHPRRAAAAAADARGHPPDRRAAGSRCRS